MLFINTKKVYFYDDCKSTHDFMCLHFFIIFFLYPPVKKFETFSAGNEASWGLPKNMLEYVNELL